MNQTKQQVRRRASVGERAGVGGALGFIGIIVALMIVVGLITFFVSVRGAEETLIPDTVGADLITAITSLQEKSLALELDSRFSAEHARWSVIEQSPRPGTLVKAGRPVQLVVSRGPIIDRVADYVGRDLQEVRLELQTLLASHTELIRIKEPVAQVTDPADPGIILAQSPTAGTEVTGVVQLELVVSKGPRGNLIEVPDYVDMAYEEALASLASFNLPFVFRLGSGEEPGVIVSQSPEAGQEIPYGSILQLEMTEPTDLDEGMVFGLLETTLPDFEILVDVKLEVLGATDITTLLEMKHPGGPISIPFVAEEEGTLILSQFGEELLSRSVESQQVR